MFKNCNNITDSRQVLKERILDTAMPIFEKKGVKSVKMDDIASMMGISKRTLYEVYENKEELLLEGIKHSDERMKRRLAEYVKKASNEMDILLQFMKIQMEVFRDINPVFFSDIRKYPKVMEYTQEYHSGMRERSKQFMDSGMKNGYFMPNLNYEILAAIGDAFMEHVMLDKMYERFSLQEIMRNFVIFMIRGFCTDKGLKIFDDFLRKNIE